MDPTTNKLATIGLSNSDIHQSPVLSVVAVNDGWRNVMFDGGTWDWIDDVIFNDDVWDYTWKMLELPSETHAV